MTTSMVLILIWPDRPGTRECGCRARERGRRSTLPELKNRRFNHATPRLRELVGRDERRFRVEAARR